MNLNQTSKLFSGTQVADEAPAEQGERKAGAPGERTAGAPGERKAGAPGEQGAA